MTPDSPAKPHVFDATTDGFEADVLQKSMQIPVLVDFWAEWCGPCKQLGPILEKVVAEYHGAFELAKVDVDKEPQLGAAFQVRSIPTVFLVMDGQIVDGFPGALPESQVREFLSRHGVEPGMPVEQEAPALTETAPPDPHAEVERLRDAVTAAPENDGLKLDLALALLQTGAAPEAEKLLDALPANLSTDDRAQRARARIGFSALLTHAPPAATLEATIAGNPDDLRARHLRGAQHMAAGESELALQQFIEMLRRDRAFADGLPRKVLIDAFRVIEDDDLVGRYRRKMASLLF